MPRPKGSKNKPSLTIEEQMAKLNEEIDALKAQIKEKQDELAHLKDLRDQEKMKALMDAVAGSGKSVDDVIAMIKSEA